MKPANPWKLRSILSLETLEERTVLHAADVLEFYLPPQRRLSSYDSLLTAPTAGDPMQIAMNYLHGHVAELGLTSNELKEFIVSDRFVDTASGATHLYLRQTFDGKEVMYAEMSVGITAKGEVIHVASSFVRDPRTVGIADPQFVISAQQAFSAFAGDLGLDTQATSQNTPAKLVYVPTAEGLELAWRLNVQSNDLDRWYGGLVDADTGESIFVDDGIGHAAYNVFASPLQSPSDGGRSLVVDPHDATASPFGWHDTDGLAGPEFTDTRGNNASVQEDADSNNVGGFRPSGGAGLIFDFPLDIALNPANYQSAAATNLFYWVNRLHDIHYRYGFTEAAGNFQVNNYGHGGLGNDPVIVDFQDGNADPSFFTPIDGQSPRMTMPVNLGTNPARDAAFDTSIFIHEYGHGVTERLTGGPTNNTALNALQSAGMAEGWSDWYALMLTQVPSDAKLGAFPIGTYYLGQPANGAGVRRYPYSFDKAIDPLTLGNFNGGSANNTRHKAGEIWASALWDLNWLLIDKHGFDADVMHGNGGNNLALQLVMDGLKLQGTNPSFLAGRDAILAADVALTGGLNQAEIWNAFARRGMGKSASDGGSATSATVTEAFDTPGVISGTVFRDDDADGVRDGGEPGLAGWTVYRDTNNNGVLNLPTTTTFNSVDAPKAIGSPGTTYSDLVISGLAGTITDINVTLNVTHPYDGELFLTLLSPNNTPIILSNYLGGSGDNFTNTTFDDEAATLISNGSAPFTGSFKPYFNLSQLNGRDPNGNWRLRMDDSTAGNAGALLNWSLQITYGVAESSTVTDADGNYSFYGLADATYHIREVNQAGFTQTAPASGVHDVLIAGGQSIVDRNFGNRAAATVANASTLEDTLSAAIAIAPTSGQGVTHFKISGITGGTLFKNNGTTQINNGDFITVADGSAGVKFLPAANSNLAGSFSAELSQNGTTVVAGSSKATSTIAVTPVGDTPQVSNVSTAANTLSGGIVISRNSADGAEVSHFKISGIAGGTLYKSNGTTPILNGSFISFAEGQAGVRFLPTANSNKAGTFDVESSQDASAVAPQSGKATATISITGDLILDDGDVGFATAGAGWAPYTQGYQGDVRFAAAGNGSNIASWTFHVTPGLYRIAATWSREGNRASDAPFTLKDGATSLSTILVNQKIAPNDFTADGVTWKYLGAAYSLVGSSLTVELSNLANGYVIADAIRVERLGALPVGAEIHVVQEGIDVISGGSVSFGASNLGAAVQKSFTIYNIGVSDLTLTGPINLPAGFSIVSNFSTPIARGGSATFTVQFDAASLGSFAGPLSFQTSDSDEANYVINVSGTVEALPAVQIFDNTPSSSTSFTTAGPAWVYLASQGFQNDITYAPAGTGDRIATWTFPVAPGLYQVSATWNAEDNRASNSPFTVFDGANNLGTITLNQKVAPNDFGVWENLAVTPFVITGTTLIVTLSNNANGFVIADGIRIEKVGAFVAGAKVGVKQGTTTIASASVFDVGSTYVGTPISKTFTVTNNGSQTLNITSPLTVPTGFTVTATFGSTSLAPGASTTVTVEMSAASLGSFSGAAAFTSNDSASPFGFTLFGTVLATPAATIQKIDNADASFTTIGSGWVLYGGQGVNNSLLYHSKGSGLNRSEWTFFTAPGIYQVSVAYKQEANRATNAPFTVRDGDVPIRTEAVNQRLAPTTTFSDSGATKWKTLPGTFTLVGNKLVVSLSDLANGFVIADSVRIEKVA